METDHYLKIFILNYKFPKEKKNNRQNYKTQILKCVA